MNIKTNLLEEYINFVDNTKKQNKNLWICTIILVFIVIILTIITFKWYLITIVKNATNILIADIKQNI